MKLKTIVILNPLLISLVGAAFKIMHWPGANLMLIVGLASLSIAHMAFAFLPAQKTKKEVLMNFSRNVGIATLIMGSLFYLMHWSGSTAMLIAGAVSATVSVALEFAIPDDKIQP